MLYQRSRWHSRSSSYGSRSQYIRWNWNNVPRRDQWSKLFVETIEGTKHTPYLKSETTFYYITNSGEFRHWEEGRGEWSQKQFFSVWSKNKGGQALPVPSPDPPLTKAQFLSVIAGHGTWHMLRENKRGRQTREEEDLLLINDKAMMFIKFLTLIFIHFIELPTSTTKVCEGKLTTKIIISPLF